MNKNIKNIAVIGAGHWGTNLVRNFYELGVLHTVCDSDLERTKQLAKNYPGVAVSMDLAETLCNPKIRGVVIATPAITHYTIAKTALEAGKDVFVEKPMAMNVAAGENLLKLSEETGKILLVGHLLEYHPCIVRLKKVIDSGQLGDIHYIYSTRLNLGKFRDEENILWSFAPHDIAVILLLLGESPVAVSAFGGYYLRKGIADVTFTTMQFNGGVTAHIFVSWLYPYKEQKLVVVGSKSMAVFEDNRAVPNLTLYANRAKWVDGFPHPEWGDKKYLAVKHIEPLRLECLDFFRCMITRQNPRVDARRSLEVLKVLEKSQKSLEENKGVVPMEEHNASIT